MASCYGTRCRSDEPERVTNAPRPLNVQHGLSDGRFAAPTGHIAWERSSNTTVALAKLSHHAKEREGGEPPTAKRYRASFLVGIRTQVAAWTHHDVWEGDMLTTTRGEPGAKMRWRGFEPLSIPNTLNGGKVPS